MLHFSKQVLNLVAGGPQYYYLQFTCCSTIELSRESKFFFTKTILQMT